MRDSALNSLVIDPSALAEEALEHVLRPLLQVTPDGALVPTTRFDELPAAHRVLCVMLSLHALCVLNVRDSAAATPAEVARLSGMAGGTVRPKLAELLRARLVAKERGSYSLPLPAMRKAMAILGGHHAG